MDDDPRSNILRQKDSDVTKVFAAGDCRREQSSVLWAIHEGPEEEEPEEEPQKLMALDTLICDMYCQEFQKSEMSEICDMSKFWYETLCYAPCNKANRATSQVAPTSHQLDVSNIQFDPALASSPEGTSPASLHNEHQSFDIPVCSVMDRLPDDVDGATGPLAKAEIKDDPRLPRDYKRVLAEQEEERKKQAELEDEEDEEQVKDEEDGEDEEQDEQKEDEEDDEDEEKNDDIYMRKQREMDLARKGNERKQTLFLHQSNLVLCQRCRIEMVPTRGTMSVEQGMLKQSLKNKCKRHLDKHH